MNNFSINPNINLNGFQNSIGDYNKAFSGSLNEANKSFEEIFNSVGDKNNNNNIAPLEAGIALDAPVNNLSPTAKMAQDIGKGFSNSLNELNQVQRTAETDFETFASGGDISVHEVMISAQKSNLSMQMAIQLRNQMINAYNEFKNMAI